jgi:hypothetical protein
MKWKTIPWKTIPWKTISAGILATVLVFNSLGYNNLDYVKEHSDETWNALGYKVVGYEGYQIGMQGFNEYGGARVWYVVHKLPDNGITYSGALWRWGDEIHVYRLSALDAIKP